MQQSLMATMDVLDANVPPDDATARVVVDA